MFTNRAVWKLEENNKYSGIGNTAIRGAFVGNIRVVFSIKLNIPSSTNVWRSISDASK